MDANRPYPNGIVWDEAWRQRQRADNAEAQADHVSFEHEVEMQQLEAKLAAAEAERVTPETILAVAELHGTIYDLRQLLETAVDAMESNHDWQAHEFCKCGLRRHWYERAKQLTAEPSGNPGELPETIPVRFQEPTPMAPRTLQD
jgi:hypothetical protein